MPLISFSAPLWFSSIVSIYFARELSIYFTITFSTVTVPSLMVMLPWTVVNEPVFGMKSQSYPPDIVTDLPWSRFNRPSLKLNDRI